MKPRICSSLLITNVVFAAALQVQAADVNKAGTGTDLAADASWVGAPAAAPTSSDIATWESTSLGAALTLDSAASWDGIKVNGALSDIDVSGTGAFTLGTSGIDASAATEALSISNNIVLNGSQTWTSGSDLTATGAISGTGTLTLDGTSATVLSSSTFLTGTAQTIFTGADLSDITATGGLMGGAWVNSGTPLPATGYYLDDTTPGTLSYWLETVDFGTTNYTKGVEVELIQSGGDITARAIRSKLQTGTALPLDFNSVGSNGTLATSQGGSGYGGHTTTATFGTDTIITLSGDNTYAGGTVVDGGLVIADKGVAFNGTQGGSFGTGSVTINSGATVKTDEVFVLGGGNITTRVVNINGGTANVEGAGLGGEYIRTLNMTGGTVTADTGTVYFRTPNGGGDINTLASADESVISAGLEMTWSSLTVNTAQGAAANDLVISGTITQYAPAGVDRSITKEGDGTLLLTGTNTYAGGTIINGGTLTGTVGVGVPVAQGGSLGTGDITINTGGTLRTGADRSIGGDITTRTLNINGGTANIEAAGTGGEYIRTLNMTGGTLTADTATVYFRTPKTGANINTLASADTSTITTGIDMTYSSLTIDVADGSAANDFVISGDITQNTGVAGGAKALTKTGAGTLELSGSSTYTGATLVSAGTLFVNGSLGNTAATVGSAAVIGGTGELGGSLHFEDGAVLNVIDLNDALLVNGNVTFANFGFDDLIGFDVETVAEDTYTLLDGTNVDLTNVANVGIENAYLRGDGKLAYFQSGSMQVVVVPEPGVALLGGLGLLALLRRRRD